MGIAGSMRATMLAVEIAFFTSRSAFYLFTLLLFYFYKLLFYLYIYRVRARGAVCGLWVATNGGAELNFIGWIGGN